MGPCPIVLFGAINSDLLSSLPNSASVTQGFLNLEPPRPECDAREKAIYALRDSILKKYQDGAQETADERALELWQAMNNRCQNWQPPVATNDLEALCLGEFQSRFLQCFERPDGELLDFSPEYLGMHLKPGPGASHGVVGTDYYTKLFVAPLTTTKSELYWEYFKTHCLSFDLELQAEYNRSAFSGIVQVIAGSKVSTVPKNREISRVICSEPSLNMLYQQATGSILEEVLKDRYHIDLATQPLLNQELARRGSLSQRYGTTDLKSASDTIALGFWNWAMPYPEIRDWFSLIRSPSAKLPDGSVESLHMLSSMGNGFTFPLQTLIFTVVVEAVYSVLGIPLVRNHRSLDGSTLLPGNFGVFGDDIIVERGAFNLVNRVLEMLGFIVNRDKSFNEGPFRESCGTDWFNGENVRGVYCKSLKTPQQRYALINHLNAWSSTWGVELSTSVRYLLKFVRNLPIPPWENADAGIMTPRHKVANTTRKQGSYVYAAFVPEKTGWDPVKTPPKHRQGKLKGKPFVNIEGILLSAVQGYLRDGRISVRQSHVRYEKCLRIAPGWAFNARSSAVFTAGGWQSFEVHFADANLG